MRLFGGLGNQLFQYFAGLSAAESNKLNLEVDFRWMDKAKFHFKSDIRDFKFTSNVKGSVNNRDSKYDFFSDRIVTKLSQKSKPIANYFHFLIEIEQKKVSIGDCTFTEKCLIIKQG